MKVFQDKTVLVTGGTGSLGKVLVRRLLGGGNGTPRKIIVFSRDEAKQHFMRLDYQQRLNSATDEVIFNNSRQLLDFRIGDVRDYGSVAAAMKDVQIVVNGAALKQVPTCEYYPGEAVCTNIEGPKNIVRAIHELGLPVETVVGVSTDKACKPVNVMGMTKALQERVFISANLGSASTRFICVRYGNVLASRGSVIPLFHEQIEKGGPITITSDDMTRFLLPLDKAVDTICAAIAHAKPGDTFIPRVPASRIIDVARALIGDRKVEIKIIGIRPGEKVDEILISDEEALRTVERGDYYAIRPMLPELGPLVDRPAINKEYSSSDDLMTLEATVEMLTRNKLMDRKTVEKDGELLR